jgi:hypothetical protein
MRGSTVEAPGRAVAWVLAAVVILAGVDRVAAGDLSDAARDRIHARTIVPDDTRKLGEVRLVSRAEDAVVVQTLLSTKLLSRVISEIAKKEQRNWPAAEEDEAAGRASGTSEYLAALHAAKTRLDADGDAKDDRRRRMLIEFAADASSHAVFIGTFDATGEVGNLAVTRREVFSTLDVPRSYVLREIRLILADAFDRNESDVDSLGPLGPASASAGVTPPAATTPTAKAPADTKPVAPGSTKPAPKGPASTNPALPASTKPAPAPASR